MKIIALQAENVKRLTAVEIKPDGNMVVISGRNRAGKTSVLDSLWWCLAGASHIQAAPIRKGAKKARIRLDLGELIVTRTFSRGKGDDEKTTTSLTVESADGAVFRSPQKVLDELLGALSFDPLGFARAKPAEQVDMLKALVPEFDFDAVDEANQADYDKRRDINRRAKELRAKAEGIEASENPGEPIDESALVDELEKAGKHNADIETRKANRERAATEIETLKRAMAADDARIRELRDEIAAVEARKAATKSDMDALEERLKNAAPLPEPIETAAIREKIARAREHNEACQRAAQQAQLVADAEEMERQSEELTAAMDERNQSKAKAIAAAKIPVEGLAFGSGEVSLAGVPFDQASDAEQLRASVAIAAALNPKLRVIRIRDGSLLDADGMKLVAELADKQDMQVWLEKVSDDARVGIHIVDGAVAAQEQAEAASG